MMVDMLVTVVQRATSECYIDLDCAPGTPRPDVYLPAVLEGTGLPVREAKSKFFGNWTFYYTDMPMEFVAAKPVLKQRITDLYNRGCIRYGSW